MPRQKSDRITPLELEVLHVLWEKGPVNVQTVQRELKRDLAYTTVQTMVYRLETKGAVRRTKKIGNAHVFEATTSRASVQSRLVKELLGLFGGSAQPLMAHLVETGKITREDIDDAARLLKQHKDPSSREKGG